MVMKNIFVDEFAACSKTRWLIRAFKICPSAMDSLRRQHQLRCRNDLGRKRSVSGKRFRKNSSWKKVRKTSVVHQRCRRRVESQTSAQRLRRQTLVLKSWTKNVKRYEHSSWWWATVLCLSRTPQGSQVVLQFQLSFRRSIGGIMFTSITDDENARSYCLQFRSQNILPSVSSSKNL